MMFFYIVSDLAGKFRYDNMKPFFQFWKRQLSHETDLDLLSVINKPS